VPEDTKGQGGVFPFPESASLLSEDELRLLRQRAGQAATPKKGPAGKSVEPPAPVDVSSLSPEKQQELASISEALKAVQGPGLSAFLKGQAPAEDKSADAAKDAPPEQASQTGALNERCRRCGWHGPYAIEATEQDKLAFVAAVCGEGRFIKAFEAYGGKLVISFRTLETDEADWCSRRAYKDVKDGLAVTYEDFGMRFVDYKMALSLERVVPSGGPPLLLGKETDDFLEKNATGIGEPEIAVFNRLAQIKKKAPLNKENVWRVARKLFDRFLGLTGLLEERSEDPDFFSPAAD